MSEFRPAVWAGSVGKKSVQAKEAADEQPAEEQTVEEVDEQPAEELVFAPLDATDAAKALAAQYNVNLADVDGTGADGRITKDDVAERARELGFDLG